MIPGMVVIALSDTLALQLLKQMVNAGDILRFGLLVFVVMLSASPRDLESAYSPCDSAPKFFLIGK